MDIIEKKDLSEKWGETIVNKMCKSEQLLSTLNSLPEESQDEVIDFAEFLARRKASRNQTPDKPLSELAGRLDNVDRDNDNVVLVEEMSQVIRKRGGNNV